MIVQKDLLSMEFYKKAVYTGSEGNMRFRIERVEVPKDSYDPITGIVVPKTVEDLDDSEEGEGDAASADDASEDLPPVEMIKLLWLPSGVVPMPSLTPQSRKLPTGPNFQMKGCPNSSHG